jgi:hypothetical protein
MFKLKTDKEKVPAPKKAGKKFVSNPLSHSLDFELQAASEELSLIGTKRERSQSFSASLAELEEVVKKFKKPKLTHEDTEELTPAINIDSTLTEVKNAKDITQLCNNLLIKNPFVIGAGSREERFQFLLIVMQFSYILGYARSSCLEQGLPIHILSSIIAQYIPTNSKHRVSDDLPKKLIELIEDSNLNIRDDKLALVRVEGKNKDPYTCLLQASEKTRQQEKALSILLHQTIQDHKLGKAIARACAAAGKLSTLAKDREYVLAYCQQLPTVNPFITQSYCTLKETYIFIRIIMQLAYALDYVMVEKDGTSALPIAYIVMIIQQHAQSIQPNQEAVKLKVEKNIRKDIVDAISYFANSSSSNNDVLMIENHCSATGKIKLQISTRTQQYKQAYDETLIPAIQRDPLGKIVATICQPLKVEETDIHKFCPNLPNSSPFQPKAGSAVALPSEKYHYIAAILQFMYVLGFLALDNGTISVEFSILHQIIKQHHQDLNLPLIKKRRRKVSIQKAIDTCANEQNNKLSAPNGYGENCDIVLQLSEESMRIKEQLAESLKISITNSALGKSIITVCNNTLASDAESMQEPCELTGEGAVSQPNDQALTTKDMLLPIEVFPKPPLQEPYLFFNPEPITATSAPIPLQKDEQSTSLSAN